MLLFSTILDIEKSLTKDSFIKLVLEWNQGSPHESNFIKESFVKDFSISRIVENNNIFFLLLICLFWYMFIQYPQCFHHLPENLIHHIILLIYDINFFSKLHLCFSLFNTCHF